MEEITTTPIITVEEIHRRLLQLEEYALAINNQLDELDYAFANHSHGSNVQIPTRKE